MPCPAVNNNYIATDVVSGRRQQVDRSVGNLVSMAKSLDRNRPFRLTGDLWTGKPGQAFRIGYGTWSYALHFTQIPINQLLPRIRQCGVGGEEANIASNPIRSQLYAQYTRECVYSGLCRRRVSLERRTGIMKRS